MAEIVTAMLLSLPISLVLTINESDRTSGFVGGWWALCVTWIFAFLTVRLYVKQREISRTSAKDRATRDVEAWWIPFKVRGLPNPLHVAWRVLVVGPMIVALAWGASSLADAVAASVAIAAVMTPIGFWCASLVRNGLADARLDALAAEEVRRSEGSPKSERYFKDNVPFDISALREKIATGVPKQVRSLKYLSDLDRSAALLKRQQESGSVTRGWEHYSDADKRRHATEYKDWAAEQRVPYVLTDRERLSLKNWERWEQALERASRVPQATGLSGNGTSSVATTAGTRAHDEKWAGEYHRLVRLMVSDPDSHDELYAQAESALGVVIEPARSAWAYEVALAISNENR